MFSFVPTRALIVPVFTSTHRL